MDKLSSDPGHCRAKSYDLVLNGVELGSGSIRIHRRDVQSKVFTALGFSEDEAKRRFGFLLEALGVWCPAAWRDCAGSGSVGDAAGWRTIDTGSDCFSENGEGDGLDVRSAFDSAG